MALLNFSWAVHIDPKGSANQHKEFTEPNQTSPEELIIHTGHLDTSSEMSSTPTTTPFTQRSTYITGPINSNYSNISIDNSIGMYLDFDFLLILLQRNKKLKFFPLP